MIIDKTGTWSLGEGVLWFSPDSTLNATWSLGEGVILDKYMIPNSVSDLGLGVDAITVRDITAAVANYRFSVQAELAIYDWMAHAMNCDGTDWGATVIWDKPGQDRPQKPYITLNITSGPNRIGDVDIQYVSLDNYSYTYRATITLSINVFANNGYLYHMNKILDSFKKECCYAYLKEAGLAYWRHYGPFDISDLLEAEFEFRAAADIILAFGHTETVTSGEIHKVKINDWPDIEIP